MKAILLLLGGIFAFVGVIILGVGIYLFLDMRSFLATAASTTGTVVAVDASGREESYRPTVRFVTAGGQRILYSSWKGSQSWKDKVGETVTVRYDPANPSNAQIDSFFQLWGVSALLLGVGGVFAAVGMGIIGYLVNSWVSKKRLIDRGHTMITEFKRIELNERVKFNNRNPWRVISEWVDPLTGQVHQFKSENLWSNPEGKITSNEIQVYVDPRKLKNYFMDTSFLMK